MSDEVLLAPYVEKAVSSSSVFSPQTIFAVPHVSNSNSGKLSKHKVNHIITYQGAFNPPHLGHLASLQSGLAEDVDDLNIVAAIIVVLPDSYLEYKNQRSGDNFILKQQDRADLWASQAGHKSQTWVYAAEEDIWIRFAHSLIKIAGDDEISIKFVRLYGTDNLDPGRPPSYRDIVAAIIATDASRKSESFCEEQREQIARFSAWQRLESRGGSARDIWCCERILTPSFPVYLILSGQEAKDFSSTRLRKALKEKEGEDLMMELETMALNPSRLVRLMLTGEVKMGEEEMAKLQNDSRLQDLV
jgi:hypothetical protein